MGTLNVINKSPYEKHTLSQCLRRIAEGDAVLLIEDAVVAVVEGSSARQELDKASESAKLYVLEPDLQARGLTQSGTDMVTGIDYAGFVDLVTKHDRVHTWL